MWSFYIGGFMFILAVLYTVLRSKEYPPSDPNWKEKLKTEKAGNGIVAEIFDAIKNMPSAMKRLALVQFLTWPGLFLMWFYYSTGVASEIFGGDAVTNSDVYTRGLEYASKTSAIQNLITFAFSFTIPFWVSKLGKKMTHTACLLVGGAGLISVNFVTEPWMLYVSMSMVGIAWASILSMPYSMLAGVLPPGKLGIYMGIFNFFIVLPEIIASLTFGKIMKNYLHDDHLAGVLVGGVLLCVAAILCIVFVKEPKRENEDTALLLEIEEKRPI
jgi:maltose/moltooligosaccharide transporter